MPRVPSSPPMLSPAAVTPHRCGPPSTPTRKPPAHTSLSSLLPRKPNLRRLPLQRRTLSSASGLHVSPLSFPPRTALTPSLSPLHPSQVCSRTSFWERSYYPPETTIINFRTLVLFCMKTLSGSPLRPQFMATSLAFGKHSLDN